jgi:hypothetical protein
MRNKILLAVVVLLIVVTVALWFANVYAGDGDGGGAHGIIIRALS